MTLTLNKYQKTAYKWFGKQGERAAEKNRHIGDALQRARITVRPDVYFASAYLTTLISGLMATVPLVVIIIAQLLGMIAIPVKFYVLLVPIIPASSFIIYMTIILTPTSKARTRAKDIDAKIPHALNFIAAMGSAGSTPQVIFSSLSKQKIYGEVCNEAAWLVRDLQVLGNDVMTAFSRAIERTPSQRFRDLMQGAITALSAGSSLSDYFIAKSEQYLKENRQDQKSFLDTLGVLAESFVVVVVAGPLLLLIMLSVMTTMGGSGDNVALLGFALIFFVLPIAQAMFVYIIKGITPEA